MMDQLKTACRAIALKTTGKTRQPRGPIWTGRARPAEIPKWARGRTLRIPKA